MDKDQELLDPFQDDLDISEVLDDSEDEIYDSEDDPEAASTIIQTFIEETEKNRNRMESAIRATDVDGIAGMAHKLLPLFTLLGASEALPLLLWLEQRRGEAVSDEMIQKANEALRQVDIVMAEARRYAAGD